MSCNKVKLDRIKAMMVVAKSKISKNLKRKEIRIYYCPECNTWHTTSKK